ncbi:hypothetical protein HRbin04_01353 [archaeon HR04]|nr:hypothetical protein HRbin04_01353 [archaeon HR04]
MKPLYYILMNNIEPQPQLNISVDSCKHRLVHDQEWVCCLCGRVFSEEEAEELQRGSKDITTVRSLDSIGLDPHGKTPLWLHGLGSIEGYKHNSNNGERDDISILSNIADKLQLPSHIAVEFLQLYRSFVRQDKDKVPATKLAILYLTLRYPILKERLRNLLTNIQDRGEKVTDQEVVDYISSVIESNFNLTSRKRKGNEDRYLFAREGLLQFIVHIATVKGAKYAYNYVMKVI